MGVGRLGHMEWLVRASSAVRLLVKEVGVSGPEIVFAIPKDHVGPVEFGACELRHDLGPRKSRSLGGSLAAGVDHVGAGRARSQRYPLVPAVNRESTGDVNCGRSLAAVLTAEPAIVTDWVVEVNSRLVSGAGAVGGHANTLPTRWAERWNWTRLARRFQR